jgi:hypothetical protein
MHLATQLTQQADRVFGADREPVSGGIAARQPFGRKGPAVVEGDDLGNAVDRKQLGEGAPDQVG